MIPNLVLRLGIDLMERGVVPDNVTRAGIRRLCKQRLEDESFKIDESDRNSLHEFVDAMKAGPVAPVPEKANEQHYEVPAEFFQHVLGEHRKYSSCYWDDSTTTLTDAEAESLRISCERADLRDGQDILELGCGWGSLTLWMAKHYPNSRVIAVSNSGSQREFIEQQARERNLPNVHVLTCDMNEFDISGGFDRIVSIEMFEHMRNYRELLRRCASWLRPDGKMFIHIFNHRTFAYEFEAEGEENWMGRYFFTGGIMPSDDMFSYFDENLAVTDQWSWDGTHYQNTAEAWLQNLDEKRDVVMPILRETYGQQDAVRWFNRWRVFFMACAELFGYLSGSEWGVGHYVLQPAAVRNSADAPADTAVGATS